jgi:hypothetical protein
MSHITENQFRSRFTALILGGRDFPKKQLDRHVLYISALLGLAASTTYSEGELKTILGQWSNLFGEDFGLDHVTLRRYLVDEGYLKRDSDGTSYRLSPSHASFTFDEAILAVDLVEIIEEARAERARKKQQYMRGTDH